MKITILSLHQKKGDVFSQAVSEYFSRIKLWKIENLEVFHKDISDKEKNSQVLSDKIPSGSYVVLLDEKGADLTSQEFSQFLEKSMINSEKQITFVIGGPAGISDLLKEKSEKIIRFGHMTWPHKMVRLMLLEQLYRGQQILNNHPYHKT